MFRCPIEAIINALITYGIYLKHLTLLDLCFDAAGNLVDASPLVLVLRSATNHEETFQNVDDVVDATALHAQLLRAAVEEEYAFAFDAVVVEEPAAEFSQRFLLARVVLILGRL